MEVVERGCAAENLDIASLISTSRSTTFDISSSVPHLSSASARTPSLAMDRRGARAATRQLNNNNQNNAVSRLSRRAVQPSIVAVVAAEPEDFDIRLYTTQWTTSILVLIFATQKELAVARWFALA